VTNIICVSQDTIQTRSNYLLSLALNYHTIFFRNKVPWWSTGRGGTLGSL